MQGSILVDGPKSVNRLKIEATKEYNRKDGRRLRLAALSRRQTAGTLVTA